MKLFLTSAGFVNKKIPEIFLQEVGKEVGQIKIFMVVGTRNPEEEFYVKESEKELNNLGIKNKDWVLFLWPYSRILSQN